MPIPKKNDDISENFGSYEDEKSKLEEQDIKGDHKNSVGKSLDIESHAKNGFSGHMPQDGVHASELSSFLKDVSFGEQEFSTGEPLSNIKYYHPGF